MFKIISKKKYNTLVNENTFLKDYKKQADYDLALLQSRLDDYERRDKND